MKQTNSGNKRYKVVQTRFVEVDPCTSGNSIRLQNVKSTGSVGICIMVVVCGEYGVKYTLRAVYMQHFVVYIGSLRRSVFTAVIHVRSETRTQRRRLARPLTLAISTIH